MIECLEPLSFENMINFKVPFELSAILSRKVHHVIDFVQDQSRRCLRTSKRAKQLIQERIPNFDLSTLSPSPSVEDRQYDTSFGRHAALALCRRPARSCFPPVVLCEPSPLSLPHTMLEPGRYLTDLAPARGLGNLRAHDTWLDDRLSRSHADHVDRKSCGYRYATSCFGA